jgi:hypothetical protein
MSFIKFKKLQVKIFDHQTRDAYIHVDVVRTLDSGNPLWKIQQARIPACAAHNRWLFRQAILLVSYVTFCCSRPFSTVLSSSYLLTALSLSGPLAAVQVLTGTEGSYKLVDVF